MMRPSERRYRDEMGLSDFERDEVECWGEAWFEPSDPPEAWESDPAGPNDDEGGNDG